MSDTFSSKRIAKNSIFLYVRMLFTMWLNLWATRLLLCNLGIDDMGIYNIVGGIVFFAAIFSLTTSASIRNFITLEIGKKDGNPQKVFCSSLNIVIFLSVCVWILMEIVGLIMLRYGVNIPIERMSDVYWVFQFSLISTIISFITIPYIALVVAHEKMGFFAISMTAKVFFTWLATYLLIYISANMRLQLYAVLLVAVSFMILLMNIIYCYKKFPESHYRYMFDRATIKEIGGFLGISTISNTLQVLVYQVNTLLFNWLFHVTFLNAVYQIAKQLQNSVESFASNVFKAFEPQITKTYAERNIVLHNKLVYTSSKFCVYMIYFIMIPFLFRTEYILGLWLGEVPDYTVSFTRLAIFLSLTFAIFDPIRTAIYATKNIKKFLLIPDVLHILFLFPFAYFTWKITKSPVWVMGFIVILEIFMLGLRIIIAMKETTLDLRSFFMQVLLPCGVVLCCSFISCYCYIFFIPESFMGLFILLLLNSLILLIFIYFFGLNHIERQFFTTTFSKFYRKAQK